MKKYKIFFNKKDNGNYPKRYRSEFIEPGICSYEDMGMGTIFIGSEALDKMNPTFISKPVINEDHLDLTPEEAFKLTNADKETNADGVVYEVGKLPNGWRYNDFIVWDLETQNNIDEKGYSVSCAYIPTEADGEGEYHGVPYDEEILNGAYTHHCIVKNPRYEKSKVYELPVEYQDGVSNDLMQIITNSKGVKKMRKSIFKHLLNAKKKQALTNEAEEKEKPKDDEKENTATKDEEMTNMEGSYIEDEDGKKIPLEEAVNAYKAAKQNAKENEKKVDPDDKVDVDGEMVNASELKAAYKSMKKNAEVFEGEPPAEDVVDESQQRSMTNAKGEEKKTSYFKIVKNAANKTIEHKVYVNTKMERIKKGSERYGSKAEVV